MTLAQQKKIAMGQLLQRGSLTATELGVVLFFGIHGSAGQKGALVRLARVPQAYARPAGKVLWALSRDGLIHLTYDRDRQRLVWVRSAVRQGR